MAIASRDSWDRPNACFHRLDDRTADVDYQFFLGRDMADSYRCSALRVPVVFEFGGDGEVTPDEFLAWEAGQPNRYEFIDGGPVQLEPSTQARSLLIVDIVSLLRPAVRGTTLRVLSNFRIRYADEVRYPAVVIDSGPYIPDATEPSQPYAIIDVDRDRDWATLHDVRYLSLKTGDDPEQVLTFLAARTN
ncbi:Uma2 family endonuclease [Rhizobium leguminosarum]|uniref:Uncharacterized protein n=1 Tax=Rhizobium leguminosarum TaxID=384 RepID=A0A7K3VTC0_RHILE|nr:Uma2 family endonuclease [Rhizobium leguminosarum]NEK19867.1 hypothetical protein [Rhizobium leguminosarum]